VKHPLAKMFHQSPFKSLQHHMRVVVECVNFLPAVFEALAVEDREQIKILNAKISETESEADRIKNTLREHLPKGLFMPVDRRDVLVILDMQDSIADVAEDIVGLLVERQMTIPEPMKLKLLEFLAKCIGVCNDCLVIIEELDELLQIGFRGKKASKVEEMVERLNLEEDKTDKLLSELISILFKHEDEMKPVSVVFWYQMLQWIGDLADYAEKTGNRLRLLIAR